MSGLDRPMGGAVIVGRRVDGRRTASTQVRSRAVTPIRTGLDDTAAMTIVRWVFVLAIVGFILTGVALFDIADRIVARSAGAYITRF
jgi:hypothetical protein